MMRRLLLPTISLLTLLALPAAASAAPTGVTAGTVTINSATSVTVNGTVNPNGQTTDVEFQLDDSSDFGSPVTSSPADQSPLPTGTTPTAVSHTFNGLTAGQTYFYRVLAENTAGPDNGVDVFGPTAGPYPEFTPSAITALTGTTGAFADVTATTAVITGTVTPNGLPTQARFRFGTSTASTQYTPPVLVGSGTSSVPLQATLTGLPPYTRIYYVMRASRQDPYPNSTIEPTQLSFITDRALTGITAKAGRVTYNGTSTISGNVTGAGNSGVGIDVQSDPYPYDGAYTTVLSGNTGANGAYSLRLAKNTRNARIRVVTKGSSVVTSSPTTLYVAPSVGFITKKQGARRLLRGTIRPRLTADSARAKIQRRVGRRWVTVKSLRLSSTSGASSKYSTTVGRRSKTTKYRVQVSPGTSAYATGTSRTRSFK